MDDIEALRWGSNWDQAGADAPWRPLPTTVEEITPEWLTAALSSRAPGLVVKGFEIVKVRHGFTSVIQLALDLNEAGKTAGVPDRIAIKGGFTAYSRTYAYQYAMEAAGYRDVWPEIGGLKLPATYFIDIEPARRQSILIMEDLNARGVTWGHGLKPWNFEQLKRRLTMLADTHARTWDSPDLKPGGKWDSVLLNGARLMVYHMDENGFIIPDEALMARGEAGFKQTPPFFTPEGWAHIWERPQNAAASVHFRDMDWNRRAMLHLADLMDTLPNCIIHGDTHLGNQYEEADGSPGFFDTMPRREPAFFELAYTITCGLDPLDRRKWEQALVAHYVDVLEQHGVKYSFEDAYYYYCLSVHLGYIWFIVNDTVWQSQAFNTVNVWRHCQAMIDNNVKELYDAAFQGVRLNPLAGC